jgi:hypothetical protein
MTWHVFGTTPRCFKRKQLLIALEAADPASPFVMDG